VGSPANRSGDLFRDGHDGILESSTDDARWAAPEIKGWFHLMEEHTLKSAGRSKRLNQAQTTLYE